MKKNNKDSQERDLSTVGGNIPQESEAVDLGLPSGTLWAPWNVGAKSAGEAGAYFTWGEVQAGKSSYGWNTYWWMADGEAWPNPKHITKYQAANDQTYADWYDSTGEFIGDGKTKLEASDDAATVNWRGKWRMPTLAEFKELDDNCTWEWKAENEYADGFLAGYLVTGPNGKSIFLPAAGCRWSSDLHELGSRGYYWSSKLDSRCSDLARILKFYSGNRDAYFSLRCNGFSVRAVLPNAGGKHVPAVDWQKDYDKKDSFMKIYKDSQECDFSTVGGNIPQESEAVDLGLPSGTLWAPWNVGASSAGEAGAYFAWGETTAKSSYSWDTYKWCENTYKHINKYTIADGKTECNWYTDGEFTGDGKTTLEASDDAAIVNWGGKWRMPTDDELKELCDKCTWEWKKKGGYAEGSLAGFLVTGPNGNSLFLPAAGIWWGSDRCGLCWDGRYWSSELSSGNSYYARSLHFLSDRRYAYDYNSRSYGFSVRAVLSAAE